MTEPTDGTCRECGRGIVTRAWDDWLPRHLEYCTPCWFSALDGAEREVAAKRAKARRGADTA